MPNSPRLPLLQVTAPKPQETLMWEEMARCCFRIKDGQEPTARWLDLMEITQRVVNAVMKSLEADCSSVQL